MLNTDICIALQNEYISRHTVDSIMDRLKGVMLLCYYSAAKCGMVKTIKCGGQLIDHKEVRKMTGSITIVGENENSSI